MTATVAARKRPKPPEDLLERLDRPFLHAPECAAWLRETFIESSAPLYNEDHAHLQAAVIGVLWTAKSQQRHMRAVVGQAEMPQPQGNAWVRGRQEQQLVEWFGLIPDFLLTFDAHYALACDDRDWCRLVEHELYHCGQKRNEFGAPKFTKDGMPSFGIRGHDIEEFVGVIRRYGATDIVREVVDAASAQPIKQPAIDGVCGTCRLNL